MASNPERVHNITVLGGSPPTEKRPQAIPVSTIESQRVEFFWPGRLAAGKITVIDGDPGLGKSTLTLEIAARFSTGQPLYGGEPRPPRGVLIMSAEDGEADTIRPRLEVAGADLARCYIFKMKDDEGNDYQPIIPDDLAKLEWMAEATNAGLIIIDPFMAFLSGEKNANRDQDVRAAMAPLASMAERLGCSVIILRHLNKSIGSSPLYRGGGSIGIIGAARFGFLIAKDPEDATGARRILAPQKINIGPEPPALAYHLESVPGSDVARIAWEGEIAMSTVAMLEGVQSENDRSARMEARSWLTEQLAKGPMPVKDLQNAARNDGVSWRTLERVKHDLDVKAHRDKFGNNGKWVWTLPFGGTTSMHVGTALPPSAPKDRTDLKPSTTSLGKDDEWPDGV